MACSATASCAACSSRLPPTHPYLSCCTRTRSLATCTPTPSSPEPVLMGERPYDLMTTTPATPTMTTLAPATHELERQLPRSASRGMARTLARNQEAISHHVAYTEF